MAIVVDPTPRFESSVDVAIVGAGACGLVSALAARDLDASVVLFERDVTATGSTSLSSGFIPAAGTRWQQAAGVADSPALFREDLLTKSHGASELALATVLSERIGPTLHWLADRHGLAFELLEGFLYPGHRVTRMHCLPQRTGEALQAALLQSAVQAGADLLTQARVVDLLVDRAPEVEQPANVLGVQLRRPDGKVERIGCQALVLACNGFGGNPALVAKWLPEMAEAVYFGHAGNQGDAVHWGEGLHAELADMTGYQGHGSLAHPHAILITWALMTEGGVQINRHGARFSNELDGYSEQARRVISQPQGIVWDLFDARLHRFGLQFPDYHRASDAGAVIHAEDLGSLAVRLQVPVAALQATVAAMTHSARDGSADSFGRTFRPDQLLRAPYCAVQVTGALFHTQGGLGIDTDARVLGAGGRRFPNLFAAGGAARGVSGPDVAGYLSGNGLLSAVAGGAIAGRSAAACARAP